MCGICGIIHRDHDNPVAPDTIERMKATITHRGPNDHGTHIDGGVGLGFQRLSIIDLEHGHQPMCNEDESVWIVFNGEIYNHADLRPALEAKGHRYRTRCDTETIVHLYEEEGIDGFAKLNGMFAICLWDQRKQRAVLVRDRLGIKPLYYTMTPDGLVFGSEIKAVLQADGVSRAIDPASVEEYLTFRFPGGENTLFRDIHIVQPGEVLILEGGNLTRQTFWDLPEPGDVLPSDKKALTDELDRILDDSVKLRLMSDVPVGAFCSGGIDSGLTTAYATKHGMHGIHTFSVGFHEADFDESPYAKMVSDRYETTHHMMKIDNEAYADSLPRIIWYHDEPLNHANSVPIHHVARLASDFVTVVLTGEGADELFGGYPRYNIAKVCAAAMMAPRAARRMLKGIAGLTGMRRVQKLGYYLPMDAPDVAMRNSAFLETEFVRSLLPASAPVADLAYRRGLVTNPDVQRGDLLDRMWRLDLRTYLVSLLHRMDKMTMAASIEARVPFLDHRLVEWALRVPPDAKLHRFTNKYLVRRLGLQMLPSEVIHRPKSGFGVPIGRWVRDGKLMGRYMDLFFDDEFGRRDYMNVSAVRALVKEHLGGGRDHGEAIWNLMNLELWHRIFLDGDESWLQQSGGAA